MTSLEAIIAGHPAPAVAAALIALALAWLGWRAARKAARLVREAVRAHKASTEGMLTLAVAGLATAVAVTGMFHFFGVELHDSGAERALFCGVLELAAFAEAVRAKRNMAEHGSAGIDGAAMWALAALSGVLSAWAAGSLAAAAFRFSMPLVAAWLWHRGLALARRRAGGRSIAWRITPERVLVRLGLADPTGRTSSEVAAQRRLTVLAQAAKRVRTLELRAGDRTSAGEGGAAPGRGHDRGCRVRRPGRRPGTAGGPAGATGRSVPGTQPRGPGRSGAVGPRGSNQLPADDGAAEGGVLDLVVMLGFGAALAHLLRVPEVHPEVPALNGQAHPGTALTSAPGAHSESAPGAALATVPEVHPESAPGGAPESAPRCSGLGTARSPIPAHPEFTRDR